MTNLGLIRRVGGKELSTGDQLEDRGGDVIAIQTRSEKRGPAAHVGVGTEKPSSIADDFLFRLWTGKRKFAIKPYICWNIGK